MEGSILNDIKKMLGLHADYTAFDQEIIIFINSTLAILYQIGIGTTGYAISSADDTWADYLGDSPLSAILGTIKSYIALKTRILWDPPASSTILQAFNEEAKRQEWYIYMEANPSPKASSTDSEEETDSPYTGDENENRYLES